MFYLVDLKRNERTHITHKRPVSQQLSKCRHRYADVRALWRAGSTTRIRAVPRCGRSLAEWRGIVSQIERPPRRLLFSRARTAGAGSCSRDRIPEPSAGGSQPAAPRPARSLRNPQESRIVPSGSPAGQARVQSPSSGRRSPLRCTCPRTGKRCPPAPDANRGCHQAPRDAALETDGVS